MLINLKNKDTLIIDEFKFKCCIGKKGIKKNKFEGDKSTPKGLFSIGKLYYRADRVPRPKVNLNVKKIYSNLGWCNDSKSNFYNSEIKIKKNIKHEKLFRKDYKYNYILVINYNPKKIPNKGSAIFIHLTKNYTPTAGCLALKEIDFLIMLKLIKRKTKIKIN
jgi:L,D-peptidoglycan transpeptidase YkuD (ErfK/YbiS/YcfS/YnhG family)